MPNISRNILKDFFENNPTHEIWDGLCLAYWFDNDLVDSKNGYNLSLVSDGDGSASVDEDGLHLSVPAFASSTNYAGAYYDGGNKIFNDLSSLSVTVMAIVESSSDVAYNITQGISIAGRNAVTQSFEGALLSNIMRDYYQGDYHSVLSNLLGQISYAPLVSTNSFINNDDPIMVFNRTRPFVTPDVARTVQIIKGTTQGVFDTDDGFKTTSNTNAQYTLLRNAPAHMLEIGAPYRDLSWDSNSVKKVIGPYLSGTLNVKMLLVWERYVEESELDEVLIPRNAVITATPKTMNPPTGLVSEEDGSDSIDLAWDDGSIIQGIDLEWDADNVDSFAVYKAENAVIGGDGEPTALIDAELIYQGTDTSLTWTDPESGIPYFFQVLASNAKGGVYSSIVSATWYNIAVTHIARATELPDNPELADSWTAFKTDQAFGSETYEDEGVDELINYWHAVWHVDDNGDASATSVAGPEKLDSVGSAPAAPANFSALASALDSPTLAGEADDIDSIDLEITNVYTNKGISLQWDAVAGAVSYTILKEISGYWEVITVISATETTYDYRDTVDGVACNFKIQARNADDEDGDFSEPDDATWYDVASYQVFRDETPTATTQLATGVTSQTYEDESIEDNTKYYYRVKSVDSNGYVTDYSNEISDTSRIQPDTPINLFATVSGNSILLSWEHTEADDFSHYQLYRGTAANPTTLYKDDLTDKNYKDNDVEINTRYFYRVKAVDDTDLESEYSNEVSAIVLVGAGGGDRGDFGGKNDRQRIEERPLPNQETIENKYEGVIDKPLPANAKTEDVYKNAANNPTVNPHKDKGAYGDTKGVRKPTSQSYNDGLNSVYGLPIPKRRRK